MESLDPNVLGPLALGGGLSLLLVWLGERYRMLEHRHEGRCPACGVVRRRGACSCTR
ncbi:MAG TPA: hypothetical protein VFN93_00750 [Gaiellaceae bacterium]|nr:hypothetical protein [Gaiellaceae bacterium]